MLDVSKIIIGEEINANLVGIHPVYDVDKMSPSWKVDSLLCAAYFSIFYLNPELELYRPCQNPRCGKYFLVKATSTRVRYCSTACCNRVTQDRYRKKKREMEGK
jgi:predicted RNA-binding Zn ribbon-like protein